MNKLLFNLIFFILTICSYPQNTFPDWAKGIVWYQIFPERFANGDKNNDPTGEKVFKNRTYSPADWQITEWTSNWFEMPTWGKKRGKNFRDHIFDRRYGGDIEGIIQHLDYLKDLGIGAIYLNPIFDAVSLHKYDGSTYHHIDFNFGPNPQRDENLIQKEIPDDPSTWIWTKSDSIFLVLINEVHKRNMKIIIDGVFNHTGVQFWAFQDIIKNGINSKYKDWYLIKSFDNPTTPENEFDYKGWWGTKSLPEFNRTENDLVRGPKQYIFHSTQRWMDPNNDGDPSDGIDGWRLDVAREVPIGFWKDWSKLVKSTNPNSIIVGELWELSPDYISENGVFDALMNYNFAFAVNDFFIADKNQIKVSEFINKLKEIDATYPQEYLYLLQNLLDSHDTERLSSMIVNPDRKYDHDSNEKNPNYSPAKPKTADYEKQKLIAVFQMTYRGAPMIYYGDEVGMWGADDPHDRKPMIWEELDYDDEVITRQSGFKTGYGKYEVEPNNELKMFYKNLIHLRNSNSAFLTGTLNFLYVNDEKKSFVFERNENENRFLIAFNLGNQPDVIKIPIDESKIYFEEMLSGEKGMFSSEGTKGIEFETTVMPKTASIYKILTAY